MSEVHIVFDAKRKPIYVFKSKEAAEHYALKYDEHEAYVTSAPFNDAESCTYIWPKDDPVPTPGYNPVPTGYDPRRDSPLAYTPESPAYSPVSPSYMYQPSSMPKKRERK